MQRKVFPSSGKQWQPFFKRHQGCRPFIVSYRTVFEHQNEQPWAYDDEMPPNMRHKVNRLSIDYHGFGSNWTKHWLKFDDKSKRNAHHAKDLLIKQQNSTLLHDYAYLDERKQRRSKSNLRKMKKTKIKEVKAEEISSEAATKYLDLLQNIRDGVKSPKFKSTQKHLPETVINNKKLKRFIKQIEALNIVNNINDIEKKSELPCKQMIDDQCKELNAIYEKITQKNESKNNCLFHLDLYTLMLISYGKIGRIHRMMSIYTELKTKNLQISNSTIMCMLEFVSGHESLIKQIWNEYLNDFRKGKIAERPSLELFNALMKSHYKLHGTMVYEVLTLFKMMTEEFKILPDSESTLSLLISYQHTAPPRYKSAQKLIAKMRDEYDLSVEGKHYAVMLSIISTKWGHFNRAYFDLEDVDDAFCSRYKDGIDLQRCMKVFDIVIGNDALKLESGLLSAIIKACRNANNMSLKEKMNFAESIIDKYVLLNGLSENERFEEFSKLEIESNVCSELIELHRHFNDFDRIKTCFDMFCTHNAVKDRFVIDCDLFVKIIDAASTGLKHLENENERSLVAMKRIEWIEAQMDKYDILHNTKVWYMWLMLAKRLKIVQFTNDLLLKMDDFIDNTKYFEFTVNLLQAVIEALFRNNQMDRALAYYSKYYTEIKLFSHWDLKSTGQREIDFHGFRAGFACVALQWILENEYPPSNISKYLLRMYGDKNPNISLVIGQGHHNQAGVSRLFMAISEHIATLSPEIKISQYPNNPGQVILNGDDVVRWRKHNGHQIDTVKINDSIQLRTYIDLI